MCSTFFLTKCLLFCCFLCTLSVPVPACCLQMIGSKIIKPGGAEPDDFEKSIAQALVELEANSDLKPYLRDLHITRAREIEFGTKKVSYPTVSYMHKSLLTFSLLPTYYTFRLSSSMFPFPNKRFSKRSKSFWFVNWRRNSLVNMSLLLANVRFCPSPPVRLEIH